MAEILYWRGYKIEVLQRFTNAINFKNPYTGVIDQRPINEFTTDPNASFEPTPVNELTVKIGTEIIDAEIVEERQSINPAPTRLALPEGSDTEKSELQERVINLKVRINSYDISQLEEFARRMKGVGRQTGKVMLESKPETGYKDFASFKEIVDPKIKQSLNWGLLESQLSFD